ncbi:MAG TPA: zf-TFIIB domain-containing protein [Alphaproteobacteria bacterium]|nr:zf-TFIIB domain-containing protein [Alphaproteobacteria bacterium]
MKCPIDQSDLVMADRQGIEIDYCPKCRGVWLDRGELDKIIERTTPATAPAEAYRGDERRHEKDRYEKDRYEKERMYGKPHKKRESFLSDIFDF